MPEQTTRKYALTKVEAGDYLLPSNDGQTLWRLHTYQDGRACGLEDGPELARYWAVSRWAGRIADQHAIAESLIDQDWNRWEWYAGSLRTRVEAIEEALRH